MLQHTDIITNTLALGDANGPSVLVKECLDVQGLPTRCGSAAFADAPVAVAHSDVVACLIAGGAHITGTTTMHELAFGVTGANAYAGTALNPLWPDRIPGGSSSGSAAAVAAGLCDFAIGTDTGGSIRQPACCCGIYGLKPTQDAISRRGAIPRSSSLDAIGPFAASAEMLTRAAGMLLDGFAPLQIDAPKLGRVPVQVDADIIAAVDGVLSPRWETVTPLDGLEDAFKAGITLINYELAGEFGHLARSNATLGADVRARLLNALTVTPVMAAEAEQIRTQFTQEVDNALTGLDALVLPTMPCVPPTWDQAQDPAALIPLTKLVRPFNLSGHPALTVPLRTAAGLPAGLQLVGRKGEEALLCAIAEFLERQLTTEPFVEMIG